jgi:hypothetical protein
LSASLSMTSEAPSAPADAGAAYVSVRLTDSDGPSEAGMPASWNALRVSSRNVKGSKVTAVVPLFDSITVCIFDVPPVTLPKSTDAGFATRNE